MPLRVCVLLTGRRASQVRVSSRHAHARSSADDRRAGSHSARADTRRSHPIVVPIDRERHRVDSTRVRARRTARPASARSPRSIARSLRRCRRAHPSPAPYRAARALPTSQARRCVPLARRRASIDTSAAPTDGCGRSCPARRRVEDRTPDCADSGCGAPR